MSASERSSYSHAPLRSVSSIGRATHIAVLVKDNHVSKVAFKLAKSLIVNTSKDTLSLVHVVGSELASYTADQKVLSFLKVDPEIKKCISCKILVQHEGVGLAELISESVAAIQPDLLVIGSQGLCNDALTESENANRRGAPPLGTTIRRKPARLATAMRLAQALHQQVPLLLVKDNSVGALTKASSGSTGMRCMVDLTSTCRHALEFLLSRMQPGRGDSMVLSVGRAMDANEQVRQHAVRLLTTFGVQVSVSQVGHAGKRLMREPSHKALPQAVVSDEIDVLMLQSPRCRDLSPAISELIIWARTAVLLWPPDRQSDGTTVKPPHPLRAVLDESLPEEARPLFRPKDSPENLVLAGPWRGRAPRFSFRERDDENGPAMLPVVSELRRSMSEAARGTGSTQFSRMERALMRSLTTAAVRTGRGQDYDAAEELSRRSTGDPYGFDEVADEPERTTWPPRAGPAARVLPRQGPNSGLNLLPSLQEDDETPAVSAFAKPEPELASVTLMKQLSGARPIPNSPPGAALPDLGQTGLKPRLSRTSSTDIPVLPVLKKSSDDGGKPLPPTLPAAAARALGHLGLQAGRMVHAAA